MEEHLTTKGKERLSRWQHIEVLERKLAEGEAMAEFPSIYDEEGRLLDGLSLEELTAHLYCAMKLRLMLDGRRFKQRLPKK